MNKIGWCNLTWNPVWGCRNNCPYCYARAIAKRFHKQIFKLEFNRHIERHPTWAWTGDYLLGLKDFEPTFLESQFDKKFLKKPQRIFVGSMSEIYHWEKEWVRDVLNKILEYPQHTFIFLTKFPEVYSDWYFHENCWLGVTITDDKYRLSEYHKFRMTNPYNNIFVCFEPLLESKYPITINLEFIDWVILGAESGNRKGKVLPGLDPVLAIVRDCQKKKIPLYIKYNLSRYYDFCRGYQHFPTIKKL